MLKIAFIIVPLFFISMFASANKSNIPLSSFSQLPSVQLPMVSPDGKNIAVILNQDEFTQVAIVDFDNHANLKVILQLGTEKYRIDDIDWANNDRILVTVSQPFNINKMRVRTTHLYSASIDGKDVFEMRKRAPKNQSSLQFFYASPSLLSLLEDEPDYILVTINDPRDDNYSSVFKVNVTNGDFEKYLPNGKRIVNWVVTPSGDILMARGVDKDPDTDISYFYTRKDTKSDWQLVKTYEAYKTETFSPQMYDPKTNTIIVLSDHVEDSTKLRKKRLWKFNINQNKFTELMGEAPGTFDITGAITRLEGKERNVIGFTYNNGFIQREYFDQSNQSLSQQISSIFLNKGLQAYLWDWDKAKKHYIISTVSDKKPTSYFLFDKTKNKLLPWFGQYPSLNNAELADVKPFEFSARDGMQIHGYLTLPNNVKNPPVVLFPHGGPYARDSQYFEPYVQLFASRGYAVIQVNFRGSTGYGNDYETAGYLQWGKKMQTDLLDALDWVEGQKLADTNKACIVGASYGGYAALVAGYQTPDKFKCIVSIAGVSDLGSQIEHWKRWGYKDYIKNAVIDDDSEQKKLSPIYHANLFKAPVLLIHGKVDIRVSYNQSEEMYSALKKENKEVAYELFDYGTHHLNDAGNLKQAMKLIDSFLAEHL